MSEVTAVRKQQEAALAGSPVLLCELEPWHRVFFRNLGDFILRREPPPVATTALPVPVARDYFIKTGIDATRIAESYGGHIAAVAIVYLICTLPFFTRAPQVRSAFENTRVEYYPLSDYLPPINTAAKAQMRPRKGAPKLAKQEILSVPPNPDDTRQTIVTPPQIKLQHDVALPNIVAWTPIPAAQPVAASARSVSQLKVPHFEPEVVAPAQVKSNLHLPKIGQPSVIEPTVSASQLKLQTGQINIAEMQPEVAAPKLPVPAQRAAGVGEGAGKDIPAAPSVQNLGASQGQGQLIALGLNPADVHGPISIPSGNRSGEFHASPSGSPDAPGTPNITGTGTADQGGGHGNGTGGPPGIMVGDPPPAATTSAVAGMPNGGIGGKSGGNGDLDARKRMIAAAMKPSLPSYHPAPPVKPPETFPDDPARSIEERVFGTRRYYSLIMNMPNLTSATGSWIIRFAELRQSDDKTPLTAPVAMTKVDPAYPPDVLRDHVEGTVTLYAVIRADGAVDNVRVLNSLDERLDQNAVHALLGWRFRPGTKNGEPVPLEAVVQIPFRMTSIR